MFFIRKNGATSNIFRVKLRSSSTGQGLTGLTISSTGLIISTICDNEASATAYTAAGSTIETIATLGTFATPTATKCRFKEVDSTNHPGLYEVQLADARFAVSSAKILKVNFCGAASLLDREVTIQLTATDIDDSVRQGLTSLPNAAAEASGGLFTRGTGAGQINQEDNGYISTNVKMWLRKAIPTANIDGVPIIDLKYILGTILTETSGQIAAAFKQFFDVASPTGTMKSITRVVDLTNLPAITTDWLTATGLATSAVQEIRDAITGGSYALSTDANGRLRIVDGTGTGEIDTLSGAIAHVILTDTLTTYTGNTPQTGDNYALTNSGTFGLSALKTILDAIKAKSDNLPSSPIVHTLGKIWALDDSGNPIPAAVWGVGTRNLTALGFTLAASDLAANILTSSKIAADALGASQLATDAVTEIVNAVWANTSRTLSALGFVLASSDLAANIITAAKINADAIGASQLASDAATEISTAVWASASRTLSALGFTLSASDLAAGIITSAKFAAGAIDSSAIAADAIGASELASDAVTEIRNAITGGAYALDTDANGRLRIVDGTGAGEINTNAGAIALVDVVTTLTNVPSSITTSFSVVQKLLEADEQVDTSTSPWELVIKQRGTATELLRKRLFDSAGLGITDTDTVVARSIE